MELSSAPWVLVFSCLSSCLVSHLSSSLVFHLVFSLVFHLLSRLSPCLVSRLVFLSPCVVVVVVVVCCVLCVVCVVCCVLCVVVCHAENPPCVRSQNVPVCTGTTRTCIKTCARGAGTHGDILNGHTGGFFSVTHHTATAPPQHTRHNTEDNTNDNTTQLTKICPRRVITCFRGSPKVSTGSYTFSV